ncbi:MAG: hypothetical protein LVS60_08085 [Nodosilinea sp. LVE1205-7]|jgi:predicted RNA-binding Zn-ribbon protein involved in translation (DUF1610 family)
MEAFSPIPPEWTDRANHTLQFCCPGCGAASGQAVAVWINRRAPVYREGQGRQWQEFYLCGQCQTAWWAWSSDRPPTYSSNPEYQEQ